MLKRLRFSSKAIVFILVGLPLLIMGIAMMYDSLNVLSNFLKTKGVVTSYIDTGEGSGYYLIQFVDQRTGNKITGTTNSGVSSPTGVFVQLYTGKLVDILYDPQNPTNIRINSFELWFWPIMFMFSGSVPLVVAFREASPRAFHIRYCLSCGKPVNIDAVFCNYCGDKLKPQ